MQPYMACCSASSFRLGERRHLLDLDCQRRKFRAVLNGARRRPHLPLCEAGAAARPFQLAHPRQRVAAMPLRLIVCLLGRCTLFESRTMLPWTQALFPANAMSLPGSFASHQHGRLSAGRCGTDVLQPAHLRVHAAVAAGVRCAPRVDLREQECRRVQVKECVPDVVVAHSPHDFQGPQCVPAAAVMLCEGTAALTSCETHQANKSSRHCSKLQLQQVC